MMVTLKIYVFNYACLYVKQLLCSQPMEKHLALLQCSGGHSMGFRKQPIGRLHFKVAKGEIITANTKLSMASSAVITERPKSVSSTVFRIYCFVYQYITL